MSAPNAKNRQRGLTLVELMIALTLSMVMLAGVLVVFAGNKVSYRMQEGLSTVQDSGRHAISQIKRDVELAGFGGCLTSEQKFRNPSILADDPLPYVEDFQSGLRITGEEGVSGFSVDGKSVLDGTDVIQIRGPLRSKTFYVTQPIFPINPVVVSGDASAFAAEEFLMISDCSGADIFEATAVTVTAGSPTTTSITHTTGNTRPILTRKYGADAVVTELTTHTYFIAQSDWPDDAGGVVLSLFRSDGTGAPEEILQGVEDMQIAYGIDANDDGQADTFEDASTVADWTQVVSTRFSLLMNSIDPASDTEANYLYVGGSVSIDPSSASPITPADRLLRQEFIASMAMRNNIL